MQRAGWKQETTDESEPKITDHMYLPFQGASSESRGDPLSALFFRSCFVSQLTSEYIKILKMNGKKNYN